MQRHRFHARRSPVVASILRHRLRHHFIRPASLPAQVLLSLAWL